MEKRALNLFFKYPEIGRVKTRLARDLGDDFVFELYKQFIMDILKTGRDTDSDIIITYSSTKNIHMDKPLWNEDFTVFTQEGDNLGMRMFNSFSSVFQTGYDKSVLIGSDSPDISSKILKEAFDMLQTNDIILGPSRDGGYYLIALNRNALEYKIFTDVPWSTSGVLKKTLENIETMGKKYHLLPEMNDIDELVDLKEYYHKYREDIKSYTIQFLSKNLEVLNGKI